MRLLLLSLFALALMGCGSQPTRDESFADRDLDAFLAFLDRSDAARADVEARLGPPRATFEGGRVAAYRVARSKQSSSVSWAANPYRDNVPEWSAEVPRSWERTSQQLMIEYDAQGKVVRHNVIAH